MIPGFSAKLGFYPRYPITAEDAYLCALEFMYEVASSDWEELIPNGYETFTQEVNGLKGAYGSFTEPGGPPLLQNKHIVLGLLQLMNALASRRYWCNAKADLYLYNKKIGQLGVGRPLPNRINATSVTWSGLGPVIDKRASQNLTAKGEIVDPEDRDVVISYEMLGNSIPRQTLFNAALNAMAKSAPAENDYRCTDFAGLSSGGEVTYMIQGNPPGTATFVFTYGLVRTALRLLPARFYRQEHCGEVKFDVFCRGEDLGGGSFFLS